MNQIRKGGTFVQYEPRKTLIFMIVNEVEERTPSMDFCIVTWHIIDYRGLNVQRRFSMAARDGVFSCFVPMPRRLHRDAVTFMRQCDKEIKKGMEILRKAYVYAQRIDWLLSGDDGEDSFHRRLKEDLEELKQRKKE